MSVDFQSIQSTAYVASSNLVITKPASVAVGDLLIGFVQGDNAAFTWPAGWNTVKSLISGGGGSVMIVYYRTADSSDVAAANYTVTSVSARVGGCIIRITGQHSTNPVGVFAFDDETASSTPSFVSSVTPNNSSSLLLFFLGTYQTGSTTRTASGYAVATSNPTWTERLDQTEGTGSTLQMSVATATRVQVTATGNASVTMNGSCVDLGNIMVVVRPSLTFTATETESVVDTLTKKPTKYFLETESVVDTLTGTRQKDWTNTTKSSSSWTNVDKS